jgi:hypothetical protein
MSMTPDVKERAASVEAPLTGNCAVLSVTDTAARFAIPATWAGKFVTLLMDGCDADIVFGGSSVSCTYGQTSSVTSEAITINAASGMRLKDGAYGGFQMPLAARATHFSVDCVASGSGKLYIYLG